MIMVVSILSYKNIRAYGDGGLFLQTILRSYKKIKRLRFYGIETVKNKFKDKYYSFENGFNSS